MFRCSWSILPNCPPKGLSPICAHTPWVRRLCTCSSCKHTAHNLVLSAEVFLGSTSDWFVPWQQLPLKPFPKCNFAKDPSLTGGSRRETSTCGNTKSHLSHLEADSPGHRPAQPLLCSWRAPAAAAVPPLRWSGAWPAPARRTPAEKWL